jgi:hypothetical protein
MNPNSTCYTIVYDDLIDVPSMQDLRNALQKGSDEVKLETMRRIIVGTLNGQSYVSGLRTPSASFYRPVICLNILWRSIPSKRC